MIKYLVINNETKHFDNLLLKLKKKKGNCYNSILISKVNFLKTFSIFKN